MSITVEEKVSREDIIQKFNERIRDWAAANVNIPGSRPFVATTRVSTNVYTWGNGLASTWYLDYPVGSAGYLNNSYLVYLNTTAAAIAANSAAHGGTPNAILNEVPDALGQITDYETMISADPSKARSVASVLKEMLVLYSRVHKAEFRNTGNLEPLVTTGVVSSNQAPSAAQIRSDVDALIESNNIKDGELLDSAKFLQFIEGCKTAWTNRCLNSGIQESFRFSYCHNSCHTNRTCYSSRGRR